MNRITPAICLIIIALSGIALAQKTLPRKGTPKPFNLPKHETFQLRNGMKVTLVPYGIIPKVTVSLLVRAGNINEGENQIGLANLTGAMLKEGTISQTAEQIALKASTMGGSVNVSVDDDTTTISGDVLSQSGPQFLSLLADIVQHPAFPSSELTRLKANRIRRLALDKSHPGALAYERFSQILYPNHPYGRIYPTEEVINSYTIEDVREFYRDNFGAERTNIYVAGKFDATAMRQAITKAFDGWARRTDPVMNIPEPTPTKTLQVIDRPNSTQSTLYIGLPVIDPSHPDYIPFTVTNALLGGSFSSRITLNIRENKGYTYGPWSHHSIRYRDAFWVQTADVTTAVTGPTLKEIFYEIERLRKEMPGAEEVNDIKKYLAGIFVLNNSSRQGVIEQLAFADLHGLPEDYLSTYVQKIMAVTPQDVQRIARQYISPERMTIVIVGDKAKIADQIKLYEASY